MFQMNHFLYESLMVFLIIFLEQNPGSAGLKSMNPFNVLYIYNNKLLSRKAESIYTSTSSWWEFLFHYTTVTLTVHYVEQNIHLFSTGPINKILISFLS